MESTPETEAPAGSQSLLRGLQLIEILSNFPNGCPLAKLSELSGLNKSTTHRLLQGLESAGYVTRANGDLLRRKVGAAVVAARRGGAIHTFDTLNHFFFIGQMVVPGSCYWNVGIGREIGEVERDEEGMKTMRILGENMAWLLKRLHA